jgi:hypothetical protein
MTQPLGCIEKVSTVPYFSPSETALQLRHLSGEQLMKNLKDGL